MAEDILNDMYIDETLTQDSGYTKERIPEVLREQADYILVQEAVTGDEEEGYEGRYEIIKAPDEEDEGNYVGSVHHFIENNDLGSYFSELNILSISKNGKWMRNF